MKQNTQFAANLVRTTRDGVKTKARLVRLTDGRQAQKHERDVSGQGPVSGSCGMNPYSPTIDRIGTLYENGCRICLSNDEIRNELRDYRGRRSSRRNDYAMTLGQVAALAEVPFGTASTVESTPQASSLRTIQKIAAVHGKKVALIFYDEVK